MPQQLLAIWEKGVILDVALEQFCDDKILLERNQIFLNQNKLNKTPELQKPLIQLQLTGKLFSDMAAINSKLSSNLFEKILGGKLIALGYKSPINSDFPSIIPLHMWPPKEKNISESSISRNGITFLAVRIVEKSVLLEFQDLDKSKIELPKLNIVDKTTGRPSQEKDLVRAFEWMLKNNRVDKTRSLKAHMPEIDFALSKVECGSTIGDLNYKTINRHLGKLFKQFKKSQN